MNLYTFGYLHSQAERVLAELIALKIPLVDVRKNPTARNPRWTGQALAQREGLTYYWIENLGNDLYQQESGIQIHDIERGLHELERILHRHERACLMCACATLGSCHRSIVADAAARRFKGLVIVHLPAEKRHRKK